MAAVLKTIIRTKAGPRAIGKGDRIWAVIAPATVATLRQIISVSREAIVVTSGGIPVGRFNSAFLLEVAVEDGVPLLTGGEWVIDPIAPWSEVAV